MEDSRAGPSHSSARTHIALGSSRSRAGSGRHAGRSPPRLAITATNDSPSPPSWRTLPARATGPLGTAPPSRCSNTCWPCPRESRRRHQAHCHPSARRGRPAHRTRTARAGRSAADLPAVLHPPNFSPPRILGASSTRPSSPGISTTSPGSGTALSSTVATLKPSPPAALSHPRRLAVPESDSKQINQKWYHTALPCSAVAPAPQEHGTRPGRLRSRGSGAASREAVRQLTGAGRHHSAASRGAPSSDANCAS